MPTLDAGLAALRDVLKPDGAMHLMVYAPYGRTGIYMLQEFCRRLGIRATDDGDSRSRRGAGRVAAPAIRWRRCCARRRTSGNEAALADALLHPQDRAYSVPQLFDLIEAAGLTFGRWIRQAPYSPHCGVMARLPQAPRLAQLPADEQYAAVELFRGTMVRHSVVAYRDDDARAALATSASTATRGLTMCRSDCPTRSACTSGLPPGAAAVLINRSHTYTDLFLPIDAAEERLVDAIDGERSIGEIARSEGAWRPACSSSGSVNTIKSCSMRPPRPRRSPIVRPARAWADRDRP